MMVSHSLNLNKSQWQPKIVQFAEITAESNFKDNIHFIYYPHGVNSDVFMSVIWILMHTLDTYVYSCLDL